MQEAYTGEYILIKTQLSVASRAKKKIIMYSPNDKYRLVRKNIVTITKKKKMKANNLIVLFASILQTKWKMYTEFVLV